MTNSFQSTAFQPQASPVDTFVQPVSVQPKSGIESLAETLAVVNPNLQKFLGTKIDEAVEDEKLKGAEIALQEAKSELRNVVSGVRKKDGDEAARQLIGGSIFSQAGYEKTKAKLLGNSASRNIKSLYETYKVQQTQSDGTVIELPIYQFGVDTPEYQEFLQQASTVDSDSLKNIRSNYVTEHYLTKQANALEDVTSTHLKQHNQFKFERTKKQALPTVFGGLEDYLKGNTETALSEVNEYIEENVILGLSSDKQTKFFESLLDVGESAITRNYAITGKTSDIDTAIEYIGSLNYGPGGSSKLRNHPQFETKFLKLKEQLNEQKDKDLKRELEKIKAAEDNTIETIIQKYPDDPKAADALLNAFPTRKEKILETVEIYETDRTTKYLELAFDVGSGLYANRPDEALDELRDIWRSHGGSATPEDKSNYDKTFTIIQNYKKAATINYDTRRNKAVRQASKITGAKFDANGFPYYPEDLAEIGREALELENEFTRDVIDQVQNTPGLDIDQREQLYRNLEDKYLRDADILKRGKETVELEEEIEALAEDSGLTEDQIKEILSEQGSETVIGSSGIEANVPVTQQETNEPGGSGKGFFDFFRKENKLNNIEAGAASKVSDEEAKRIIDAEDAAEREDAAKIYTVKSGDTLESIANEFGVELDDLVNINKIKDRNLIIEGQPLTIPKPKLKFIDRYKGKPVPDFGGLAKLIRSGESLGSGLYNAFNRGPTSTAGKMDITSKTIAEMEQMQEEGKVSAVGAYQFIKGTLKQAREMAGIESDAIMTPAVQDRLFWAMLTGGKKRPDLTAYLLGESDDLDAAHEDLALEFAVIQGPDGKGRYDKDKSGNLARIKPDLVRKALIKARKEISNL